MPPTLIPDLNSSRLELGWQVWQEGQAAACWHMPRRWWHMDAVTDGNTPLTPMSGLDRHADARQRAQDIREDD